MLPDVGEYEEPNIFGESITLPKPLFNMYSFQNYDIINWEAEEEGRRQTVCEYRACMCMG